MKVKVEIWTIEQLNDIIEKINEQPEYQRGEVWKDKKKSLLIDSILRGIDIPKIFLRKLKNSPYDFEVADGQQRITALTKFKNNDLILRGDTVNGLNLNEIDGYEIGNKYYKDLPTAIRKKFDQYELTIALIDVADNKEVRTLFGRLQLGETLNPAEKRNAIISSVGNCIDSITLNHKFFANCKIPKSRFKHQDYLTHVFALIAYNNSTDLKADLLERLYHENPIKITQAFQKKVAAVLDFMYEIDNESKARIVNKFAFIDIFWLLYLEFEEFNHIETQKFARKFEEFEKERLNFNSEPEKLLSGRNQNKDLYTYIMSFNFSGSKPSNIENRNRVFSKMFKKYLQ